MNFTQRYLRAIKQQNWRRALIFSALLGFLFGAGAMYVHGQVGAPFVTVTPGIPPAIGQPGVTLSWDTTNKLLVATFTTANSAGTVSTLSTVSYNPHTLEGSNAGGVLLSFGTVAVLLKHNLVTDPMVYQIGVSSSSGTVGTIVSTCTTVSPVPTGQTACPALPF